MGIATSVLLGVVASVLILSLSSAIQPTIQRTFPSLAPGGGEASESSRAVPPRSTSRVASSSGSGEEPSSSGEDDGSIDRAGQKRSPATGPESGAAPGQSVAASYRTDPAPSERAWSNPLSALASLFPVGTGGGASGAPAPRTAGSSSAGRPSNGGQVREVFFGTTEGSACQPGDRAFVLADLSDLYVCVIWAGLSGKYVAKITFVLPDGNVYQTMTVPFLTVDAPASIDPMVEIDGQQVQAKRAGWGANGEAMVTVVLPVAGTFITQYSMGGLWTVRVALNGQIVDQDNFDLVQP